MTLAEARKRFTRPDIYTRACLIEALWVLRTKGGTKAEIKAAFARLY
jgi:hypothetical protein